MKNSVETEVLFMSYGGGHSRMLMPVFDEIRHYRNSKFLALTSAVGDLEANNIPNERISDVLSSDDISEYLSILEHYNLPNIIENLYTAIGLYELRENLGFKRSLEIFERYGRFCLCPRKFSRKIISYYQPKALVCCNLVRLPRACFAELSKSNVQTLYIEDLFLNDIYDFTGLTKKEKELIFPDIKLDYMGAHSAQAKLYISQNLAEQSIVNSPDIRVLGNYNIESTLRNVKKYKDVQGGYILYLTNKLHAEEVSEFVRLFAQSSPEITIRIRPHPNEKLTFYEDRFLGVDNVEFSSQKIPLSRDIAGAIATLTTNSTSAYEALLVGKPSGCVNPMKDELLARAQIDYGMGIELQTIDDALRFKSIVKANNYSLPKRMKIQSEAVRTTVDFIQHKMLV